MTWNSAVKKAIHQVCYRHGGKDFTRYDLIKEQMDEIVRETNCRGKTPEQPLSRVLQNLRDEGYIDFVDDNGNYRLLK